MQYAICRVINLRFRVDCCILIALHLQKDYFSADARYPAESRLRL